MTIRKLSSVNHAQPYKGPFSITRVMPNAIIDEKTFGPLSNIDHAVMQKGLTVKMHEHINDEILSYVKSGTSYHQDSAGFEVPISPGQLMMMNAGESFWHEEKVKQDKVEMLQIFVRPRESDLKPAIQFHQKPVDNKDWYLMVGPEKSAAPLHVRQNVFIFDAHPEAGDELEIPIYQGLTPFLYVMEGEISVGPFMLQSKEAVTDLDVPLPAINVFDDSTLVLFFVDLNAPMSLEGTISGIGFS